MRRLLICVLLLCAPAVCAEPWIRIATADFELFTDAGEQKGRDAIVHFEQVRSFFLQASPVKLPAGSPVRIIIFRDKEEFAPFAPNGQVIAYFTSDDKHDYIVMADASPESYPVAIHEYMHLVIRHSGLHVPVWLNEGWAEVYSSLRPVKDGIAVGDLLPGRMKALTGNWFDFQSLDSVTTASAIYNESDRAGIFYAESWALAHMLFLSPEYKDGFPALLAALHYGKPLPEALEAVYHRSPDQVFEDLKKYFARRKIYGAVFRISMEKSKTPVTVSAADSVAVLRDLRGALEPHETVESQVQRGLAKVAARDFPAAIEILSGIQSIKAELAPAVFSGLAYSTLQLGDLVQARQYMETARKWARTAPEKTGIEQLAGFIDARAKSKFPPKPGEQLRKAAGMVNEVSCAPTGSKLVMDVGTFILPEPAAVEFTHQGGGSLQIQCGKMVPFHVSVEYADGVIRRIQY